MNVQKDTQNLNKLCEIVICQPWKIPATFDIQTGKQMRYPVDNRIVEESEISCSDMRSHLIWSKVVVEDAEAELIEAQF